MRCGTLVSSLQRPQPGVFSPKVREPEFILQMTQRRLVAEQHFILKDPKGSQCHSCQDGQIIGSTTSQIDQRIHLGPSPTATAPALDEEDEGLAEGPLERMLRNDLRYSGTVLARKKGLLQLTLTIQKKPPLRKSPF